MIDYLPTPIIRADRNREVHVTRGRDGNVKPKTDSKY